MQAVRRKTATSTTTVTTEQQQHHWILNQSNGSGKRINAKIAKRDLLDPNRKQRKVVRRPFLYHLSPRSRKYVTSVVILLSTLILLSMPYLLRKRPNADVVDSYKGHYSSQEEEDARRIRFPSVEERVKVYMSNWYVPPCPKVTGSSIQFTIRDLKSADELIPNMASKRSMSTADATKSTVTSHDLMPLQQVIVQEVQGFRPGDEAVRKGTFIVQDNITMAQLVYLRPKYVKHCAEHTNNEYCPDLVETLLPALERAHLNHNIRLDNIPVIAQFGDSGMIRGFNQNNNKWDAFPALPHIMKFRYRFEDPDAIAAMTASDCHKGPPPLFKSFQSSKYFDFYQPILWKVTSARHYGMISKIPTFDIPYEKKKDMVVFRGALTGLYNEGYKATMKATISDRDKCLLIQRCRLVYKSAESPIVDAKLTTAIIKAGEENEIPDKIGNVELFGSKLNYEQMLSYKGVIMLEGNDISSGLKWALYSNSVVLTQPPTKTSWALEELLEPWVHYVPLNRDLSDVETKMQWVLQNPEAAKKIAHQGSLFIRDLLFHPDVTKDDEKIYDEMIHRYRAHFVAKPSLV